MNNRLILNLIHRFRLRPQRGFALPMAMMIGAVCLVVAATMLIRSKDSQVQAVSKVAEDQAMASAEAGAAQYVNFLNTNRGLIPYPSCAGAVDTTTGACNDSTSSTTTKSWVTANAASGNLQGIGTDGPASVGGTTSCSSSNSGGGTPPSSYQTVSSSTISTTWANTSNTTGWKTLSGGLGKYRLVSYTPSYTNASDVKTVNSAKLVIDGQSSSGNAKARVEFSIPVTASTAPASGTTTTADGFPGLWSRDFKISKVSVYSNVRDSSECLNSTQAKEISTNYIEKVPDSSPLVVASTKKNTGAGNDNLYKKTNAGKKELVKQGFPSLPNNGTYTAPSTTGTPKTANALSCPYSGEKDSKGKDIDPVFPRKNDYDTTGKQFGSATNPPEANATYVYVVCSDKPGTKEGKSINISSNNNVILGQSGQEKFKFYLDGSMVLGGGGDFRPLPGTKTQVYIAPVGYLDIGAGGNVGLVSAPSALQFYVYATDNGFANGSGSNAINTGTTNQKQSVRLGGNGSFFGFLFAPNANALMGGTEDVAGALWAKSIEIGGDGKVWQALFNATDLDVTLPNSGSVTTYNLNSAPSQWRRTAAQ